MKFSTGIDSLARENHFLKIMSLGLLTISVFVLGLTYSLIDKSPLIVERTSHGLEVVRPTTFLRTADDLKIAISLMLKARFDSNAIAPEVFLNAKQLALRDSEQKDMTSRGMHQVLVIRKVDLDKDHIIVDVDRVISVGELRSAIKTKLKIAFEEISPNELNPYGLLMSLAEPVQEKEASK